MPAAKRWNSTAFLYYDSTCGFNYTEEKESGVVLHAAVLVIIDIDLYCFHWLAETAGPTQCEATQCGQDIATDRADIQQLHLSVCVLGSSSSAQLCLKRRVLSSGRSGSLSNLWTRLPEPQEFDLHNSRLTPDTSDVHLCSVSYMLECDERDSCSYSMSA